jgi:dihydrofolate reductase
VDTEKVVLSTTLTEAPWDRARVVNAPTAAVIKDLQSTGDGHILINNSATVIKAAMAADLLDRLYLMITPEIAGEGERLFEDGLPATKWQLTLQETGDLGEMAMVYDRVR